MSLNASARAQIGTLIVATSGIQLANGFFGSFISLRVALEKFDPSMAGLVLGSYFAGFTIGAVGCGRIIDRIGHIRAYAAFAGLVVAATAAMPILIEPLAWMALRTVIGFGCAGVFVTTESWLNAKASPVERGQVFALYMVGTFIGLAVGQLLIGRIELDSASPFNVICALFALALVMVSATRAEQPRVIPASALPAGQLIRAAPVAAAGAALSGFITSTFYALVPGWMQGEGVEPTTIGLFMLVAVLGGLACQVPVGRLSDRFDRRIILAVLSVCLAVAAVMLVHLPRRLGIILPVAIVFGGLQSALYPVCVAYAHDRMPADRVVAISSRLILVSGAGSVLGPIVGMSIMGRYDINGVFYQISLSAVLLAAIAVGKSIVSRAPPHLKRTFEILAPQATALAQGQVRYYDNNALQVGEDGYLTPADVRSAAPTTPSTPDGISKERW